MVHTKILFANDDVLTQWVMTEVLQAAGFTVTNACRGSEVAGLLDGGADFDVLLADLDLTDVPPGMDIGERWRRAMPGRPAVFTGESRSVLMRPLQFQEAFLLHPFTATALLRTLDTVLEDARFGPLLPVVASRIHHVH